jgi:hypothetical protein
MTELCVAVLTIQFCAFAWCWFRDLQEHFS